MMLGWDKKVCILSYLMNCSVISSSFSSFFSIILRAHIKPVLFYLCWVKKVLAERNLAILSCPQVLYFIEVIDRYLLFLSHRIFTENLTTTSGKIGFGFFFLVLSIWWVHSLILEEIVFKLFIRSLYQRTLRGLISVVLPLWKRARDVLLKKTAFTHTRSSTSGGCRKRKFVCLRRKTHSWLRSLAIVEWTFDHICVCWFWGEIRKVGKSWPTVGGGRSDWIHVFASWLFVGALQVSRSVIGTFGLLHDVRPSDEAFRVGPWYVPWSVWVTILI